MKLTAYEAAVAALVATMLGTSVDDESEALMGFIREAGRRNAGLRAYWADRIGTEA